MEKYDAPRRSYFHICHDVIAINDFAGPQRQSALGLSWKFLENTGITKKYLLYYVSAKQKL